MGNLCFNRDTDDEEHHASYEKHYDLWVEVTSILSDVERLEVECRDSFQTACKERNVQRLTKRMMVDMTHHFVELFSCDNPRTRRQLEIKLDSVFIGTTIGEPEFVEYTREALLAAEDDLRSRIIRMKEKRGSKVVGDEVITSLPGAVGPVSCDAPFNAHDFSPTSAGGYGRSSSSQQLSVVRSTHSMRSADGYNHHESLVLDCARPDELTGISADSLRQRMQQERQSGSGWTEPTKPSQGVPPVFERSPALPVESGRDFRRPGSQSSQNPMIEPQPCPTDKRLGSSPTWPAQPTVDGRTVSPLSTQVHEQQRFQQRQPRQAQSQMSGLRHQFPSTDKEGDPSRVDSSREPRIGPSSSADVCAQASSAGASCDDRLKNARRLILSGNLKIQVYSAKQRQWVPRMLAMNTDKGILGIRGGEKTIHFNIGDLQRINQSLPAELLANPPPMDRFASFNFKGPRPLMVFLFESGEVKDLSLAAVGQLCGVPIDGRPPPTL